MRSSGSCRAGPSGIVVVDKPVGPTSFEVVQSVRRAAGVKKAGHAGTLDPFARGVLVVCLGEATRLVQYLATADKEYLATGRLGVVTDTYDRTGSRIGGSDPPDGVAERLAGALGRFRGSIEQVPPAFSAKRVGGRRAYALARTGEVAELAPVRVRVERLELVGIDGDLFELSIRCSKGTYVRSLVHEIGQVVGCGATTEALVRTAAGPFRIEEAAGLEALADEAAVRRHLRAPAEALPDWPAIGATAAGVVELRLGRPLGPGGIATGEPPALEPGRMVRLLDERGALVALARWEGGPDVLARPFRVFASSGDVDDPQDEGVSR